MNFADMNFVQNIGNNMEILNKSPTYTHWVALSANEDKKERVTKWHILFALVCTTNQTYLPNHVFIPKRMHYNYEGSLWLYFYVVFIEFGVQVYSIWYENFDLISKCRVIFVKKFMKELKCFNQIILKVFLG